ITVPFLIMRSYAIAVLLVLVDAMNVIRAICEKVSDGVLIQSPSRRKRCRPRISRRAASRLDPHRPDVVTSPSLPGSSRVPYCGRLRWFNFGRCDSLKIRAQPMRLEEKS